MVTDHNILSRASVRVFTVLLCVCLCTANCIPFFFYSQPTTMVVKRVAIVGRSCRSFTWPHMPSQCTLTNSSLLSLTMGTSLAALRVPLIDPARYGASHINDGVQGCSSAAYISRAWRSPEKLDMQGLWGANGVPVRCAFFRGWEPNTVCGICDLGGHSPLHCRFTDAM